MISWGDNYTRSQKSTTKATREVGASSNRRTKSKASSRTAIASTQREVSRNRSIHRYMCILIEVSKYQQPHFKAGGSNASDPDSDSAIDNGANNTMERGWPPETELRLLDAGKIKLLLQSEPIRRVTREAFKNLTHTLIFSEAFPNSNERTDFTKNALFKAAKDLRLKSIAKRLSVEYTDHSRTYRDPQDR
jgi:hypothetical protein